jgi:hypothetical protein
VSFGTGHLLLLVIAAQRLAELARSRRSARRLRRRVRSAPPSGDRGPSRRLTRSALTADCGRAA